MIYFQSQFLANFEGDRDGVVMMLDPDLDIGGIAKLDNVEASVGQVHLRIVNTCSLIS